MHYRVLLIKMIVFMLYASLSPSYLLNAKTRY